MSSNTSEDEKIAIAVVLIIVAAIVASVLGFGGWKAAANKGAQALDQMASQATAGEVVGAAGVGAATQSGTESEVASPAALSEEDLAKLGDNATAVSVEKGVVKLYFAAGKADLDAGAQAALGDIVRAAAAGKKIKISGFHDSTGSAAKNAELAKQRALNVKAALVGLGVADSSIEMVKPEVTQGSGSNAQARRVEVSLVD